MKRKASPLAARSFPLFSVSFVVGISAFAFPPASSYLLFMPKLERITLNPAVMGGKPCLRGLRVTVGTVVGLLAVGKTREEILRLYPYLEAADIDQAIAYAAWRVEEQEVALGVG